MLCLAISATVARAGESPCSGLLSSIVPAVDLAAPGRMTPVPLPRFQVSANVERVHSFRHEALFYDGEGEFLDGTLQFIGGALAAGEPALIMLREERSRPLEAALGADAARVHFADMREFGRNPARIIPAWREFLERHAPDGRPVRGVGEPIWPGRSPAELTECQRHESLLNLAFGDGHGWRLLCPYDAGALDDELLRAAWRSHPRVAQNGATRTSDAYLDAPGVGEPFDGALPAPGAESHEVTFTSEQLTTLRGDGKGGPNQRQG